MDDFFKKYEEFKIYHNTFLNLAFHFATSVSQIAFALLFLKTYSFWYLLFIPIIPYLTDGIGHILEGNFFEVLLISKLKKSTNSSGASGFKNFIYRLIALPDYLWYIAHRG